MISLKMTCYILVQSHSKMREPGIVLDSRMNMNIQTSVKTSGHHYTFPESELKDTQKQFTENLWAWFYALTIEICSSTLNSLIIIGNFWKHLTLIKASLFVLYKVIPGYFNEFIYEIVKWNISKIKHLSYEVLNLQVYFIVLMLTHGNL